MTKREYTPDFKRQVVEQAEKGEKSLAELERELDLSRGSIRRWQRQLKEQEAALQRQKAAQQAALEKEKAAKQAESWTAKQVATYDGNVEVYASQYQQVGELVDMWADLLEGHANKSHEFWETFGLNLENRQIQNLEHNLDNLTATGFNAPFRRLDFVKRGVVSIPVYVAAQGNDLYVSWRAFVQAGISDFKVTFWLIVAAMPVLPCILTGFVTTFADVADLASDSLAVTRVIIGILVALIPFAISAAIVAFFVGAYGFINHRGDIFALVRKSVNELQIDDAESLIRGVHFSLVQAADKVGIDTTKLQAREPFYAPRGRKRRI